METLLELFEEMKRRPTMYLGERSLSWLGAYLRGMVDQEATPVKDLHLLEGFPDWVERYYHRERGPRSWEKIILFHSLDQVDALDTFFRLFEEYVREKAGGLPGDGVGGTRK